MDLISSPNDIKKAKVAQTKAMQISMSDDFLPWPEKYRPHCIADVILPDDLKGAINFALESGKFNNMIFHSGKPGTGKSTVARAIPEEMDVDYLFLPISRHSSEILEQIHNFAVQKSVDGKPRFVILDEADQPSGDPSKFYTALQPLIENTTRTVRFILTCNRLHKIPEAIRSRCAPVSFAHNKDDKGMKSALWKRVKQIAINETANTGTYDEATLANIAKNYYPDMRAIIGSMMMTYIYNKGSIIGTPLIWQGDYTETIWSLLMDGDDVALRKWCSENVVDFTAVFLPLGLLAIDKIEQKKRLRFTILTGEYQYRSAIPAVDQEVNLAAYFAQLILLLKEK